MRELIKQLVNTELFNVAIHFNPIALRRHLLIPILTLEITVAGHMNEQTTS